jgi:hypothetical protein
MDFLHLVVFVATWGFMWRWVVKNRGNWNLFFGNIVGVAGGVIVAMVVLSISLSLFPDKKSAETVETTAQTSQQLMPSAETQVIAPAEPAVAVAEAVSPPAPAQAAVATAASAAPNATTQKSEPPESALLPDYRGRSRKTLSENLIVNDFNETDRAVINAKRQAAGDGADADRSYMAVVMCIPALQHALRFPSTERVIGPAFKASRQNDQIYKVTAVISADNMLAATVVYNYSCSMQAVAGAGGDTQWNLVDLSLTQTSR